MSTTGLVFEETNAQFGGEVGTLLGGANAATLFLAEKNMPEKKASFRKIVVMNDEIKEFVILTVLLAILPTIVGEANN